jgi:hypothetical protein
LQNGTAISKSPKNNHSNPSPKWNGDFQIAINLNNGLQSYGDLEIAVPY